MAHHVFRRPLLAALEAPEGVYADVEALSPTVFMQLRYPVYNGEFVLFQDAACTTPVTTAGQDTIGGVKNPFTGEIVATQSTAADRPLWEGTEQGAYFDGTNYLDVSTGGSAGTNSWAWTAVPKQDASGAFEYVSQFGAGAVNVWLRSNADGQRWEYRGSDDDGTQIAPTTSISPRLIDTTVREPITVRFEYSGTESTLAGKYDAEDEVSNSLDPSTGLTASSTFALGALQNGTSGLDGYITEAAFSLGKDASYVTSLHGELNAIAPERFDDLEPLEPNLFLQLRYPVYRGEQVLFQDAACTVPVTSPGQHTIGGVKNPFTGKIVAKQPASAARPMWEGTAIGATFDGTNYLVLESFTQPTTDATVLGRGKPVALTNHTFAATRDAATAVEGGFQLAFRSNTDPLRFQWVVNDQGGNQDVLQVDSSVTRGVSSHFGAVLDSVATEERVYLDGSEIGNRSASVGSIESSGDEFLVGANSANGPIINHWDGTIEWVSIHDAALTPTQISNHVDTGTEQFDPAATLGLNYFFQLRQATYGGEQVLFQDAACTVPVTYPGQHTIGGVKDPFTGDIIATQPNSARRPMWEGQDGAYFDGTNALVVADDASIQAGTTLSVADFAAVSSSALAGGETVFQKRNADSTTLYFARIESDGKVSAGHKDDLGNQTNGNTAAGLISAGTDYLVTLQYDRPNTTTETWVGTTREATDSAPVLNDISVDGRDIGYGGFDAGGSLLNPLTGYIQFAGQFLQTNAIGVDEITVLNNLI